MITIVHPHPTPNDSDKCLARVKTLTGSHQLQLQDCRGQKKKEMLWQLTHSHSHYYNVVDPIDPLTCIDISGSGEKILTIYTCGDRQANQLFTFKHHAMASLGGECVGIKEESDGLLLASPCSDRKFIPLDIFHISEGDDALWKSVTPPKHSLKRSKFNLPARVRSSSFADKMAELDRVMSNRNYIEGTSGSVGLKSALAAVSLIAAAVLLLYFAARRMMKVRLTSVATSKRGS